MPYPTATMMPIRISHSPAVNFQPGFLVPRFRQAVDVALVRCGCHEPNVETGDSAPIRAARCERRVDSRVSMRAIRGDGVLDDGSRKGFVSGRASLEEGLGGSVTGM